MSDLRRMFYNRYKTSSIFNTDNPSSITINAPTSNKIPNQTTFSPKFDKMTSKERYWNEMRSIFSTKNKADSPKNNMKRSKSIKETRKQREFEEKKNNLNGVDIMCRDMYNGYDPKKYLLKRCKSTFNCRSYLSNISINDKSSRQERSLAYTCSNIFNDKSKDKQIQQSFKDSKENKNYINVFSNRTYRPLRKEKSWSDFEKELSERRLRFSHSKFTTDMDWKTTNTEDIRYDTESDLGSVLSESGISKKSFRRVNILKREILGDKKEKAIDQNKESVNYNLISGNDKKNELSKKIYDKFNKDISKGEEKKDFSKKKYDFKSNFFINKYQPSVEFYEIDIPKNFDLTDINTIRNIFSNRGIHAFKIEESSNSVNNQSGKITLRIRKDNVMDEKLYNKNINNIKKIISKKDMKLNKVEGNKAKVSKIAKQRVKTPFKGEILLKPSDNPKLEKENKAKNGIEQKKNSFNIKAKTKTIKKTINKEKTYKNNIKLKK